MTITRTNPGTAHAEWFDEYSLRGDDFNPDDLMVVTSADGQDTGTFERSLGSTVRLASGGTYMTVTDWRPASLHVRWLEGKEPREADFPRGALVQVLDPCRCGKEPG